MAFGGGDERGGELGERSACGKDGESDQSFAPAEAARYGRRAVDKPVAAQYETAETADGDEDGAPQWTGFFCLSLGLVGGGGERLGRLLSRGDGVAHEDGKEYEQQ